MNAPNQTLEFIPGTIEGRTLVISDIVRVFTRYLWLLLVLSVGCALLTFIWSKHQAKLYDAVSTIQVEQHENLTLPGTLSGGDEYELNAQTQILIIQSRDVALKVISRLHLERDSRFNPTTPANTNLSDPAVRNALVGIFQRGLSVQRVQRSELITITYRSLSPVLSTEIANATVDTYLEQNFQNHYQGSKEITGWLTGALNDLKNKVQNEQSDLLALEMKLGVFSGGSSTPSSGAGGSAGGGGTTNLYETQMITLQGQILEAEKARFMAQAQYEAIKADTKGALLPDNVPGTVLLTNLESQLNVTIGTEATLTKRFGPNYPQLQGLKNEEETLKQRVQVERGRAIAASEQQLLVANQTQALLAARIEEVKEKAKGMNNDTVHFQVMRAQYNTDQSLYDGLLQLLSAGGIQAGLKTQNVNRMSVADIPTVPAWPRVFMNVVVGFFFGLTAAVIIIIIIIIVSDTVETVEQVEDTLRLPVLSAVPLYKLDAQDPSSSVAALATLQMPRSAAAESYRILRTAVNLMPVRGRGRVIGVTSCGPGEGKSTTIMNLAVAVSQQNKRVLLIDGDLRKPALAQRLKLPSVSSPGLSRYLSDPDILPEDCIQTIPSLPGLSIIPVQDIPPFPSELLAQGRLEELIQWARTNFDMVLIDTPPVLLVADALIITQSLDIVLIVARVRIAQRRALRRVREELAKFPDKHIAVVVNAVPQSQSYYGGYVGYGGYYGSDSSY